MKKLEDYKGQKIAIHFPTYELWLRRKEINPSDTCEDIHWDSYENKTYYYPFGDNLKGEYMNYGFAKDNSYTILPATDFLEEEFIYGEEYEFSNDNKKWYKHMFLCKTPNNKFVAWSNEYEVVLSWKYARKINTEKAEAITTIKELVSKHSINQNEVF